MKSSAQSSKQNVKNNQSNKEINSDIKNTQDQAQIYSKQPSLKRNKTKNNNQVNSSYDNTTPMSLSKVDKIRNVNLNSDIFSDNSNANGAFRDNETVDITDENNLMNTNSISSKSDNLNIEVETIETTSFNKKVKTDKDTTKVNETIIEDDNSYIIVSEDDPLNFVEVVLDVKPIDAHFEKDITQESQCNHEQINFRAEKNWENYATVIDIKIDPGSGDLMCVLKWVDGIKTLHHCDKVHQRCPQKVWDSHPLELGATPLEVYIDGIPQFNTTVFVLGNDVSKPIPSNNINASTPIMRKPVKPRLASSIVLKNVGKIYVDGNQIIDTTSSTQGDIGIIVKDGIVECIGINCTQPDHISSYEVIDLNGGYVLPGFTAVAPSLGLSELRREPSTTDGIVTAVSDPDNAEGIIYAIDGLKLGGKHLEVAHKAGVFVAVTAPLSSEGVLTGVSMAFETGANSVLDYDPQPIVKENVALHAQIGTQFKYTTIPTVSGQIALIRKTLIKNLKQDNIFGRAARGEIPLVVYTHSKDEIASLIRLKIQVENNGGQLNLVILGGTEAHMLAVELAKHKIPVILIPLRAIPESWTAQHALTGAPITNTTGIDILYANGVKIGIGVVISGSERNLIWDAGWAHINSRGLISEKDSLGFISWNLEEILGLNMKDRRLMKGNIANFVAYDGNPFDMNTRVKIVAGGGKNKILIDPEQD
ncbi:10938_t:CDS:2, partial [Cetraspora pellucida]